MSGLVTASVAAFGGLLLGAAFGTRLTRRLSQVWARLHRRWEAPNPLTEADRESVAAQFAQHAHAVKGQVSLFADELADGDVVLRERLRRFERAYGERWPS